MPDYAKLYRLLFNAITDALEQIEANRTGSAKRLLILAQQEAEELYMESDEKTAPEKPTDFGCIF